MDLQEDGYSRYWETEEFEDKVARGLIAMYENKLKIHKRCLPSTRLSAELIRRVQQLGCYFPASDRIMQETFNEQTGKASSVQCIDVVNDLRPDYAILCTDEGYDDNGKKLDGYLYVNYMERIKCLPKPFKTDVQGKIYRIAFLNYENEQINGSCDYVVIDSKGEVHPVFRYVNTYNPITGVSGHVKNIPNGESKNCEDNVTIWASATIQYYQDRRHLWNVRAKEGIAKATFAVYTEQIQSLFYSRELPLTTTGRKKPILHWVKAHQRRMKEGIEYDVDKYLRGTHEFVYQNTKFEIINPIKKRI